MRNLWSEWYLKEKLLLWGRRFKKIFIYFFFVVGLFSFWLGWSLYHYFSSERKADFTVPEKMILTLNLDAPLTEVRNDDLLQNLYGQPQISFFDVLNIIQKARHDNRVSALFVSISDSSLGLAQLQELRHEIKKFQKKGKKAYVYSSGFGSFGGGTGEYYLASACDEIILMPNSEVGITGLGIEIPFIRNTLNKIGIEPQFSARYEYKTGADSLTQSKMNKYYRQELTLLGENVFNQIVDDIAKDRNLSQQNVKALINRAPIFSKDALKNKLIDKIAFKTDFIAELEKSLKAKTFSASNYFQVLKEESSETEKDKIVFMVLEGTIVDGYSNLDPLSGELTIGSDTVINDLKKLEKEKNIKGIVLRINSPGGSYSASTEIYNALLYFKKKYNIPLVVSMGDYAASGGYYIAMAGDYIFADPSTITASIGVYGGKMVLSGLWKKLGVEWERVAFGNNAGMLSPNRSFTPAELKIFNASLDNVYRDFTHTVSQKRNISLKNLDKLARGRVFTGAQAQKNLLVDEIGGLQDALAYLYKKLNDGYQLKHQIVYYPKEKDLQQKLMELIGQGEKISVNKAVKAMGFDENDIKMLQNLKYEAVLSPFKFNH